MKIRTFLSCLAIFFLAGCATTDRVPYQQPPDQASSLEARLKEVEEERDARIWLKKDFIILLVEGNRYGPKLRQKLMDVFQEDSWNVCESSKNCNENSTIYCKVDAYTVMGSNNPSTYAAIDTSCSREKRGGITITLGQNIEIARAPYGQALKILLARNYGDIPILTNRLATAIQKVAPVVDTK